MSPADGTVAAGTHQKTKVKAQAKAKSDKAKTGEDVDSDGEDQTFMTPATGTTPKVQASKSDYIKAEEGFSPSAEDHEDGLVTPAVDSNQEDMAFVMQTPKKGKGKATFTDHVDDDSTPIKTTPKKRTPKNKVKSEDAAEDDSVPQTPTPKKRTRAVKPKSDDKLAPKRAMKADGKSQVGRDSFINAIAASNRLQDVIFGSNEEADVGDETTGAVREHEHVGIKETSRKIAQGALAAMARQDMVRRDGAHETLAHQDGMFNEEVINQSQLAHQSGMFDQDAADDELFTRYTHMKKEDV